MSATLPKAIQAELAAAEQLQQSMYGQPETPAEPVENTSAPAPVEPAPAQEPAPVVEPHQPVVEQPEDASLQNRLAVLQGKYNAEVPRLHQEKRTLAQQLQAAQEQIQELLRPKTPVQDERASQKDVEDFGADLIDMIKRVSSAIVNDRISQLEGLIRQEVQKVTEQVSTVTEHVIQSDEERFWTKVRATVTDWDVLDSDPRWITWLDTRAAGSRHTHRDNAVEAIQAFDVAAVIELVELFKTTLPPAQAPAAQPAKPATELQRQVVPSTSKSNSSTPASERVFTRADVERMGDPRYLNTLSQEQYEAEQAALDKAVAEGRIQW